jgi:hypothetical protein
MPELKGQEFCQFKGFLPPPSFGPLPFSFPSGRSDSALPRTFRDGHDFMRFLETGIQRLIWLTETQQKTVEGNAKNRDRPYSARVRLAGAHLKFGRRIVRTQILPRKKSGTGNPVPDFFV